MADEKSTDTPQEGRLMGLADDVRSGRDARQNLLDNIESRIDYYIEKIARAQRLRSSVKYGGYLPAEIYDELVSSPL